MCRTQGNIRVAYIITDGKYKETGYFEEMRWRMLLNSILGEYNVTVCNGAHREQHFSKRNNLVATKLL